MPAHRRKEVVGGQRRRIDGLSVDFHELVTTRTRGLERPLDRIENISLTSSEDHPELPEEQ